MDDLEWTFRGARLELCPERAAYRPDRSEVLVADVHLGKAATFRRAGRPIPKGTTRPELDRLDELVARKGARRLTILGDLFHADVELDSPTAQTFRTWLASRGALEIVLVRGNHDRAARTLLAELDLEQVDEPWDADGLVYRHHPSPESPSIAGHVHPGVRLDDGTDRMKLPAFWESADGLVLPAFGAFTGLYVVQPGADQRIAAVTPTSVVPVPTRLLASF
ncbi:MAG: ligase-associated DNA damage response endonuclease PdeM [Planctomycetota bacterium]